MSTAVSLLLELFLGTHTPLASKYPALQQMRYRCDRDSHGKIERLPFRPQQGRSRGSVALRPRLGAEKGRSIYRDPSCGNCALDLSTGEVSIHVISPECESSNIGPSVRC